MTYGTGFPVDTRPGPNGDTVKQAAEKFILEFAKAYGDLSNFEQQVAILIQHGDVDTVDGKHADGTANNLPLLNGSIRLTNDTEGTAWNIPTSDVGGNIWIAK
ncbi:hypothetical protein EV210_101145 [Anaerospora hongkongensis]|uniref:Uncharacterized protein n=1 Tax=Anaerospora hongkongensis TaxID=244830 RepID=A0A4R1Q2A7_9FIRM|nr:hypothetical protein [Anaerospora hongkongensis]TCL39947.1 hypothetical protein EV210_101145 [Anaerospora hongkongensis]